MRPLRWGLVSLISLGVSLLLALGVIGRSAARRVQRITVVRDEAAALTLQFPRVFRPQHRSHAGGTDTRPKPTLSEPSFSLQRGFYDRPIQIKISPTAPDSFVRYTTDGSLPGPSNGLDVGNPIAISSTTVVRAIALHSDGARSAVVTHTYIFPASILNEPRRKSARDNLDASPEQLRQALLSLPSVSLVPGKTIAKGHAMPISFEWLDPADKASVQADCGAATFGGAFTAFAKESFRLYFRDEFGPSRLKYPLFRGYEHGLPPVDQFDQLDLRSGSHDMEERGFYLSNIFADDSMLEMGHLNPHGRFVHVYLNGLYWGVYHLRERWNAAMHRRYLGGAKSDYESINGNWNVGGWAPGVPYDGDGHVWREAVRHRGDYSQARQWIDIPQYLDFMILWMFGSCEDEYRCVGPASPGRGFKFYVNDADGFFQAPATPWYHEPSDRVDFSQSPGRQPGDGPGSFFSALFLQGDPDYLTLLADHIYHDLFNDGPLTPNQTAQRLRRRSDELEQAFLAEAVRWHYRTPSSWVAVRDDAAKHWLPQRTGALIDELRSAGFYPRVDAPVFNQQGGAIPPGFQVNFTSVTQATTYYTVDGTDPRLLGGAVAPGAKAAAIKADGGIILSGPQLEHDTVVKARVRAGIQWSALNEAVFEVRSTASD